MPNLKMNDLPEIITSEFGDEVLATLKNIEATETWTLDDASLSSHVEKLGMALEDATAAKRMLSDKTVLESLCVVLAFINVLPRFRIIEHIASPSGLDSNEAILELLATKGDNLKSETAVLLQAFLLEMQRQFALKRIFNSERLRAIINIVDEVNLPAHA